MLLCGGTPVPASVRAPRTRLLRARATRPARTGSRRGRPTHRSSCGPPFVERCPPDRGGGWRWSGGSRSDGRLRRSRHPFGRGGSAPGSPPPRVVVAQGLKAVPLPLGNRPRGARRAVPSSSRSLSEAALVRSTPGQRWFRRPRESLKAVPKGPPRTARSCTLVGFGQEPPRIVPR